MKTKIFLSIIITIIATLLISEEKMKFNDLNAEEKRVILNKGTERAFTGKYNDHKEKGIYTCRQCGAALYESEDKFASGCGWPSFDDEISGAVTRTKDADGKRIEITCSRCKGHLGHVFEGEGFTDKNTRHCVNSISLDFTSKDKIKKAYFAGGCFWGVEHHFEKLDGVLAAVSGYSGGKAKDATYQKVSTHQTNHAETVEIVYNSDKVSYDTLVKLFFEIHDFTQIDRQGPDRGKQYRTEIFVTDDSQKEIAKKYVKILEEKDYKVATKITDFENFYDAEEYHQNYYQRKNSKPYCHIYKKIF